MFNFFRKKDPAIPVNDQVYMNFGGKMNALRGLLGEVTQAWVLCWFEETFDRVVGQLQADGLPFGGVRAKAQAAGGLSAPILVWMIDALPAPDRLERRTHAPSSIIFVGRHPLADTETAAIKQLHNLFPDAPITRLTALDEPLFADLGNIKELMEKLGMAPDEALSHPMITRSIERLQKKNERTLLGADIRSSQANWLKNNQKS